jgi:hypothetical protein
VLHLLRQIIHPDDHRYIQRFEKLLHNITLLILGKNNNLDIASPRFIELYQTILYDELPRIVEGQFCEDNFVDALAFHFGDHVFDNAKTKETQQNDHLEKPTQIREGVFECYKCGGRKTISFALQTRSADEPMTNFVTCTNQDCKAKWTC